MFSDMKDECEPDRLDNFLRKLFPTRLGMELGREDIGNDPSFLVDQTRIFFQLDDDGAASAGVLVLKYLIEALPEIEGSRLDAITTGVMAAIKQARENAAADIMAVVNQDGVGMIRDAVKRGETPDADTLRLWLPNEGDNG